MEIIIGVYIFVVIACVIEAITCTQYDKETIKYLKEKEKNRKK